MKFLQKMIRVGLKQDSCYVRYLYIFFKSKFHESKPFLTAFIMGVFMPVDCWNKQSSRAIPWWNTTVIIFGNAATAWGANILSFSFRSIWSQNDTDFATRGFLCIPICESHVANWQGVEQLLRVSLNKFRAQPILQIYDFSNQIIIFCWSVVVRHFDQAVWY